MLLLSNELNIWERRKREREGGGGGGGDEEGGRVCVQFYVLRMGEGMAVQECLDNGDPTNMHSLID